MLQYKTAVAEKPWFSQPLIHHDFDYNEQFYFCGTFWTFTCAHKNLSVALELIIANTFHESIFLFSMALWATEWFILTLLSEVQVLMGLFTVGLYCTFEKASRKMSLSVFLKCQLSWRIILFYRNGTSVS